NLYSSVIITQENSISTQINKVRIRNTAIFSSFKTNCSLPINRPITSQQWFFSLHKSWVGMYKADTTDMNISNRSFHRSFYRNQRLQLRRFKFNFIRILISEMQI